MSRVKLRVAFGGVIGIGKSTISRGCFEAFGEISARTCAWVPEPSKRWELLGILERFYEDKANRALEFQVLAWETRLEEYANVPSDVQVSFCDGHMIMDRVYLASLHEQGQFTDAEHAIYMDLWKGALGLKPGRAPIIADVMPDLVIYLGHPGEFDDTPDQSPLTDLCLARIKERGRESEKGITADYLYHLEKQYERLLFEYDDEFEKNWDVRFVDATLPEEKIVEHVLEIVSEKLLETERSARAKEDQLVAAAVEKFFAARNGERDAIESRELVKEMMRVMLGVVGEAKRA
jgi:deoxyadenosine/deoxycytidine kinase